ncbi:MAG: ATP-binding protein [Chloroflexota bacterium]
MAVDSATDVTSSVAGHSAELRTFLFADVRGYTRFTQERGDRAAAALVAKFAGLVRDLGHGREGELIELRGDEALVVFGSARQALRCAVEMQQRFRRETEADPDLPLRIGIGLDAGEAVPVEGGYRGEALNLASRLCNLAQPGEVLASEGVVYLGRRVRGLIFAERGLVPLKGFDDPVRVIRVLAEGEPLRANEALLGESEAFSRGDIQLPIGGFLGALPSGVMVGRAEEWQEIMSDMDNVAQGAGRLVLLSGEPGIGKTRLAQEVTLKARHWGFMVGTGRCYEQEQTVPYYPFVECLASLYRESPGSIRAELPSRWSQLIRLLPDELGPAPEREADGQEDQQRLFRAVVGFLQALGETQPVALLLDDLHWADDSSLKLLQHLVRYTRADRILFVGTYRDVEVGRQHPLESFLLDLGREALLTDIAVRRLDEQGTRELLSEMLGDKEDLAGLAELVYERTEGNAFFIQEMIRALVERGDVYRQNGHWERRKVQEMEVPKSVRSVIGQRLSRLSIDAQEILRDASVLGQTFQFDDLLALGNASSRNPRPGSREPHMWTEDEVDAGLEEARTAGLVREADGDHYAFEHALVQQALYAELSTRRRKRLHLAAGTVLEGLSERARVRRASELAWHFLEGDDAERALPYAMMAGDQAEDVFAHGDAERQYRTALELAQDLEDVPSEAEALERMAGVLVIVARYDEALDTLEQAASLHRAGGNLDDEGCVVAQIGQVHYLRGTYDVGIARLRPVVYLLEHDESGGDKDNLALASLYASLARLHVFPGQDEEKLALAQRAAQLAESTGDEALLTGARVTMSDALWRAGQDEEAIRVLEPVISRAESTGDLNNLARALSNAATYYARRGEFQKDRSYYERMLRVVERRGDRGQIVLAAMSLSSNAFLMGEWKRSREYLVRAEGVIAKIGASRLSLWPIAARAWLELREGNLEAALYEAERCRDAAENVGDMDYQRLAERVLAEIDEEHSLPEAALRRLEPWLQDPRGAADSGIQRQIARACLELRRCSEAQEAASLAVGIATTDKDQPELVEGLTVQGAVKAAADDWVEAAALFDQGLWGARRMPFPLGEADALFEYGRMCARKKDVARATDLFSRAGDLYSRLGAIRDVEKVRIALDLVAPDVEPTSRETSAGR